MSEESLPLPTQLVLISGVSNTGKSASLRNILNQDQWMYLNTESGKRLPFRNDFNSHTITDPYQIHDGFEYAIDDQEVLGIIVDSLTFLMDMFNTKYIYNSADGRSAWADYQQFFKKMLFELVPKFDRPVVFTAHTRSELDETAGQIITSVPIQGALKNVGIESFFSTIVSTKVVSLKELEAYDNKMLNITEDDELLGFKHVFQTRLTKKTIGERIRSPMGFFSAKETFIDNDVQVLLNHLNECYGN